MSRPAATISRVEPRASHPRIVRFKTRGASLGLAEARIGDRVRQVERGFSFTFLESFAAVSGLPVGSIASVLGIPERTLARRRVTGRFTMEESERLLRIATVFEKAAELFEGDVAGAITWLTSPKKALAHETPLEYSRTELGAREVENLIGRLEYGVFS